jgi:nitrite reductase/ring-hydroxylating ferredoxin subunit
METGRYVAVVAFDALKPNFVTKHEVEGRDLIITRRDDEVRAWDAFCPHAEFQFGPCRLVKGGLLECPMHGARFDAIDGSVAKGPATEPLEPIELRVENGVVEVLVDWLI